MFSFLIEFHMYIVLTIDMCRVVLCPAVVLPPSFMY